MKPVLIVYASKTGVTQDAAQAVAAQLGCAAAFFDCRARMLTVDGASRKCDPAPDEYTAVILGTAMYMGSPLKEMKRFCAAHEAKLLCLPVAIFTCGLEAAETDEQYLRSHLSTALMQHAFIYRHLGGEVRLERMNAFERMAMKEFEKQHGKAAGIDMNAVRELCAAVNEHIELI